MKWRTIYFAQWEGDWVEWHGDCRKWAESLRRAGCKVRAVRMIAMRSRCTACDHGLTH